MKYIFAFTLLVFTLSCTKKESFISTWFVSDGDLSVTLPLVDKGNYNFVVDWGDDTDKQKITSSFQSRHLYRLSGTYTIIIAGTIEGFAFGNEFDFTTDGNGNITTPINPDAKKIRTISSWGPLKLGATKAQFAGAEDLRITAIDGKDLLSKTTDLSWAFYRATNFNSDIDGWDVSNIRNMEGMFAGATLFNQPLRNWNVSQVTNVSFMFYRAEAFNQPLGNWNVSKVKDMSGMFWSAKAFNRNIGNWATSSVANMSRMFDNATVFNQPIGNWNVSQVTNMNFMFSDATAFNQNLSGWDVRKVTKYENFASGSGFANDNSKWPAKFRP